MESANKSLIPLTICDSTYNSTNILLISLTNCETAYNAQNAQFGLVVKKEKNINKNTFPSQRWMSPFSL